MANEDKKRALDAAIAKLEKDFGKGTVMRLGDPAAQVAVETIPTGSLSLDLALGLGGVPKGRIVEIYGPESSGKTTVALHMIAEVQKRGGIAGFIDAEHALDPVYAKNIGVDIDELYISQPDSGDQALEITETMVRSGAMDIIVVDSVAALVPKQEIEGDMGDSHVGLQARLMSQALRKLTPVISKSNCVVIFINQLREKVGVMFGNPETTTGGRALKFYASVRMDVRRIETLKQSGEMVGNRTRVKIVKNKIAPPFKEAEFDIMFGKGISKEGDILDLAVKCDLVSKSGAWFAYNGDKIGQGRENAKTYLSEHPEIMEELEKKGIGKAGVQYKMKDWAFNRQRYWGEPIPLIHCPNCGVVAVPENELPLRLPDVKDFEPGEDGQSPLAKIDSFVNCTCPKCGAAAKRETDTMPQWAGSSWYFLRYTDPHNANALADMDKLKYWMPVDWYNGGMEHVTRHMIYSRFWHHFLYDLGVVNTPEPYAKRSIQGLILGPDGDKMSKSKGNVVDPLDIVEEYGADTLRTYVLFMGDYGAATPWSENSVKGCKKFLDRVAGLTDILSEESVSDELEMKLHRTIKKVSSDIENLKFNTAIASLMTLINEITAEGHLSKDDLTIFIKLLSPFAPHICEEIWEFIGGEGLLAVSEWPKYDEGKTIAKTVEIGVQVNGKVRGTIVIPNGCEKEKAFEIAKADERIASFLEGKNLIKEIYVPNKIVNFVAK